MILKSWNETSTTYISFLIISYMGQPKSNQWNSWSKSAQFWNYNFIGCGLEITLKQSFVWERWWRVHSTEHSTLLGSGILTRQPHHAPPPCSAKRENPTKGKRCTISPHILSMLHYPQYTKIICKANNMVPNIER